jgi:hypothetical protein
LSEGFLELSEALFGQSENLNVISATPLVAVTVTFPLKSLSGVTVMLVLASILACFGDSTEIVRFPTESEKDPWGLRFSAAGEVFFLALVVLAAPEASPGVELVCKVEESIEEYACCATADIDSTTDKTRRS